MTRKFPLLFALSLCFSFFLLLGIFGKGGYIHNQALKSELESRNYQLDVLQLQVESLGRQQQEAVQEDALKDAAFKYGYQREGEQVYYFLLEDAETPAQRETTQKLVQEEVFEGLSSLAILLMALVISTMITVSFHLLIKRRRRKRVNHD